MPGQMTIVVYVLAVWALLSLSVSVLIRSAGCVVPFTVVGPV
jgi:hypothetical protein